jgi:hypothetical protein
MNLTEPVMKGRHAKLRIRARPPDPSVRDSAPDERHAVQRIRELSATNEANLVGSTRQSDGRLSMRSLQPKTKPHVLCNATNKISMLFSWRLDSNRWISKGNSQSPACYGVVQS